MEHINLIKIYIKKHISSNANIFDCIMNEIESISTSKAHNIIELRKKINKKLKGDLFEAFCYIYLKEILKHDEVWLYNNIPDNIKTQLNLPATDFGIDIVSKKANDYYAIQCKYKKPSDKFQLISWRSLSTFYAIVNKTGPWLEHITMTNVNGCKLIGKREAKDKSYCINSFRNITFIEWFNIISETINQNQIPEPNLDIDDLRLKRLQYFSK